jgi:hypothetical protein
MKFWKKPETPPHQRDTTAASADETKAAPIRV